MTRNQRTPPGNFAVVACLFAGVAICSSAKALDGDYPPPPGPYPSGPLPISAADGPTTGAGPPAAAQSASEDTVRDRYGATKLFGSGPPPAKSAPSPAPVFAPTAAAAPPPVTKSDSGGLIDRVTPQAGASTDGMPERRIPSVPISPRPPNPAITAGSDYRPPAYPLGRGFPPNAGQIGRASCRERV